jgi:hypothetical protein
LPILVEGLLEAFPSYVVIFSPQKPPKHELWQPVPLPSESDSAGKPDSPISTCWASQQWHPAIGSSTFK